MCFFFGHVSKKHDLFRSWFSKTFFFWLSLPFYPRDQEITVKLNRLFHPLRVCAPSSTVSGVEIYERNKRYVYFSTNFSVLNLLRSSCWITIGFGLTASLSFKACSFAFGRGCRRRRIGFGLTNSFDFFFWMFRTFPRAAMTKHESLKWCLFQSVKYITPKNP